MKNSGKYLEKMTQDHFDKTAGMWYHRLNDSASGRNLTSAQPADAVCCVNGKAFLLEMKSTKVPKRLPRFVQLPRMVLASAVGLKGYLLVHRYLADVYYLIDIDDLKLKDASHDLSKWPELTWEQAMEELE